jgi:hypothetical protein
LVQKKILSGIKIIIKENRLFSDIHANLPAMETYFKSIEEQKPNGIYPV